MTTKKTVSSGQPKSTKSKASAASAQSGTPQQSTTRQMSLFETEELEAAFNKVPELVKERERNSAEFPELSELDNSIRDELVGYAQDEGSKNYTEAYRIYYYGKIIAQTMEKGNHSRLIAFPSVSKSKGEWYKMGGNSALFFKYYVGKRLRRSTVVKPDRDLNHRFKRGIISVHYGANFMHELRTLGYQVSVIDYGIIVCELGRTYTEKDIKEMLDAEKKERDRVITMIRPVHDFPDVFGLLRALSRLSLPKVKRMDGVYRDTLGNELLQQVNCLYETYYNTADGTTTLDVGGAEMLHRINNLKALIAIADESNIMDLSGRVQLSEIIIDLKQAILRRFYGEEKESTR